jgi:hypothetical protein
MRYPAPLLPTLLTFYRYFDAINGAYCSLYDISL